MSPSLFHVSDIQFPSTATHLWPGSPTVLYSIHESWWDLFNNLLLAKAYQGVPSVSTPSSVVPQGSPRTSSRKITQCIASPRTSFQGPHCLKYVLCSSGFVHLMIEIATCSDLIDDFSLFVSQVMRKRSHPRLSVLSRKDAVH